MELNIDCITNELNKIIINKNKYSNEIVLYALGLIELVFIINKINILPFEFIKYLRKIKNNINCYIDLEYFNYIYKNKKKIFIKEASPLNSSSSSSLISGNLNDEVEKMLRDDSIKINEIMENEKK